MWQPWQTWVLWSTSPFYSSAPSQQGNPGKDGLVFLSLLPHGKFFQPDFFESGSPLLWQMCWGCLQVPSAFRLVKELPKRALQSPEITARADGRQVSASGRDSLVFLLRNLISPPEFPLGTWLRTPAHPKGHRLCFLITLSAWCT